jgi:hypothetical protein
MTPRPPPSERHPTSSPDADVAFAPSVEEAQVLFGTRPPGRVEVDRGPVAVRQ